MVFFFRVVFAFVGGADGGRGGAGGRGWELICCFLCVCVCLGSLLPPGTSRTSRKVGSFLFCVLFGSKRRCVSFFFFGGSGRVCGRSRDGEERWMYGLGGGDD